MTNVWKFFNLLQGSEVSSGLSQSNNRFADGFGLNRRNNANDESQEEVKNEIKNKLNSRENNNGFLNMFGSQIPSGFGSEVILILNNHEVKFDQML